MPTDEIRPTSDTKIHTLAVAAINKEHKRLQQLKRRLEKNPGGDPAKIAALTRHIDLHRGENKKDRIAEWIATYCASERAVVKFETKCSTYRKQIKRLESNPLLQAKKQQEYEEFKNNRAEWLDNYIAAQQQEANMSTTPTPKKRRHQDEDFESTTTTTTTPLTPVQLYKKQKMDVVQGFQAQMSKGADIQHEVAKGNTEIAKGNTEIAKGNTEIARAAADDAATRKKLVNFMLDDDDDDGGGKPAAVAVPPSPAASVPPSPAALVPPSPAAAFVPSSPAASVPSSPAAGISLFAPSPAAAFHPGVPPRPPSRSFKVRRNSPAKSPANVSTAPSMPCIFPLDGWHVNSLTEYGVLYNQFIDHVISLPDEAFPRFQVALRFLCYSVYHARPHVQGRPDWARPSFLETLSSSSCLRDFDALVHFMRHNSITEFPGKEGYELIKAVVEDFVTTELKEDSTIGYRKLGNGGVYIKTYPAKITKKIKDHEQLWSFDLVYMDENQSEERQVDDSVIHRLEIMSLLTF